MPHPKDLEAEPHHLTGCVCSCDSLAWPVSGQGLSGGGWVRPPKERRRVVESPTMALLELD